jgi:hypothetical protein
MDPADDRADVIPDSPSEAGWRIALAVALVAFSAVASFAAVRAWRAPARGAPVAPARLTVDTQPAGADLWVDAQRRGVTPLTVTLEPGEHTLGVRTALAERTVRVALAPGAQVVHHFELAPHSTGTASGRLSIVTDPSGVRVAVDGQPRGASPLLIVDLPYGDHVVSIESRNGSAQRTIAVRSGATSDVFFSLPRPAAAVVGSVIVSSPIPLDLIERNEVIGTSGAAKVTLAAGRHNVILRNEALGYAVPRTIEVAADRVVRVDIVPPQARVNINARPWADVTIDGAPAGQTPLANISLPIGPHEIAFRHPQFGVRTERVAVTADRDNHFAVDFTK